MNWALVSEFVDGQNIWIALSLWGICFGFYFIHKRLTEWIAPPWKQEMIKQQKAEENCNKVR
ncbi:hypothetical protein [Alteribacillus sp. YIM 98480]|uniref:hypothetical protein n=1 Tax=Alteribacillus sp. YIM 98480 TaxID=2606599 RepID=UPI00131C5F16|nr:hypothetical protein [Alteribacillus sp. YIM 98480]